MNRKAQSTHWSTWDLEKVHREKVIAKLEKIRGLKALLEEWEGHAEPDHAYILELRAKLRSAENQYNAMKP